MISGILGEKGIDSSTFRARRLSREILDRADLVITAEREHRAFVARMSPSHATKSFTLHQLSRLLDVPVTDSAGGSPVDQVVRHAQASRGIGGPASADDDIEDPWGRRAGVYRRVAKQLDAGVARLLAALAQ